MNTLTPNSLSNVTGRNAAHRGPVFLPWHRFMLLLFEQHLQRVLSDTTFGLPYWDWTVDGDLPPAQQPLLALWQEDAMGGDGIPVTTGPFAFDPDPQARSFRVFFSENLFTGQLTLISAGRGLRRQLGQGVPDLPTTALVRSALADEDEYDRADWDADSLGFRNRLEGWRPSSTEIPTALHNRVHVWIGADVGVGTSPNDPVFYLHHCNVDQIWEAWMATNGRTYLPAQTTAGAPVGYRIDDVITSLVTTATTRPADMLDVSNLYTYDSLPPE